MPFSDGSSWLLSYVSHLHSFPTGPSLFFLAICKGAVLTMAAFSWRAFKAISSIVYLFLIIVTIPLAFDVGGEDCGIAFTGTLSLFYLILSTLRILARNTKFRYLTSTLYHMQQIIIPSLLILHLSIFSPPTSTINSANLSGDESPPVSLLFSVPALKIWLVLLEPWRWFMKNATPLFTILEGFCSLLVIQTAGRVSTWLVRKRSDSWIIPQLLFSSCVISSSLYFLYRIYTFPVTISLASATLIGVVLTISAFLALFGIVSGRGNSVESSLLASYIVYCLYFTFTDFQSSISASNFLYFFSSSTRPDIPPLPPVIINGYTNLVSSIASLVPSSFETVFHFLRGAVSTVTPSVFVSLSYRLAVFFAATRIIPAVHKVSSAPVSRSASYSSLPSSPNLTRSPSINSINHISPNSRIRKIRSQHNLSDITNIDGNYAGNTESSALDHTKHNNSITSNENKSTSIYDFNTLIKRGDHGDDDENTVITAGQEDPFHKKGSREDLSPSSSASSASTAFDNTGNKANEVLHNPSALSSSATISSTVSLENSQAKNLSSESMYDDDIKEKYYPQRFNDHYKFNENGISNEFNDNNNDMKNTPTNNNNDYYDYDNNNKKEEIEYKTEAGRDNKPRSSSKADSYPIGRRPSSKAAANSSTSLQLLILAYAPCILIAVYTHLLIQHLAIFNTMTSSQSGSNEGDSLRQLSETLVDAGSRTVVAFATTTVGRVARSVLSKDAVASGSDAIAMSVGKTVVETAVSAALGKLGGADKQTVPPQEGGDASQASTSLSKAVLLKSALLSIWAWSRSWVNTPRDSWQFWGWINMFSTLALYALELVYGKQADEDIIDYHLKTE